MVGFTIACEVDTMNFEIALGLFRHVLTIVGGYYVSQGKLDASSVDTIVGGVSMLIGTVWSVQHKVSINSGN